MHGTTAGTGSGECGKDRTEGVGECTEEQIVLRERVNKCDRRW